MRQRHRTLTVICTLGLAAGLLVSCSATNTPEAISHSEQAAEQLVTLDGGWAKAAEGMSGLFGTLENHGDHDLVITGVETDVADLVELHEVTADGVMQEITGDVVIPAHGSLELVPGGTHIMLMEMTGPLQAGDEVMLTVHFDDGTSTEFTVLVKDYSGANEEYQGTQDGTHDEHASTENE